MIDEDTKPEHVDSLTVRHLRELRRRMDEYFDLLKRSVEMDGRIVRDLGAMKVDIERQLNEVRSDLILLEGRSLSALEHDAWFRTKLNRIDDAMEVMRSDIDTLRGDMGVTRADLNGLRGDMTVIRSDVNGLRGDMTIMRADLDGLRGDMTVMRTDVNGLRADMATLVVSVGQINAKLDASTGASGIQLLPKG